MAIERKRLAVTCFMRNPILSTETPQFYWQNRLSDASGSQKAISEEFTEILENVTGIKFPTTTVPGTNSIPLRQTFTYGPDIIQIFLNLPDDRPLDLKSIREHPTLQKFESAHGLELVLDHYSFQSHANPNCETTRPFQLALFDMDSTLINEEVIDELARSIGVYDQVSAITHRAMNDPSFDFAASLKARVALLKGVPADIWTSLQKKVTIATGAKELIAGLKRSGIVTGVISGGFTPMAEWLKGELGLDLAFANHLATSAPTAEYDYTHLTGELDLSEGKVIVTPEFKRETLIAEARKRGIPLEQTLAAGDGSNDLKMLGVAGLGIAWNAKPKTQEMAPMRLNGRSLAELLFLLGPCSFGSGLE